MGATTLNPMTLSLKCVKRRKDVSLCWASCHRKELAFYCTPLLAPVKIFVALVLAMGGCYSQNYLRFSMSGAFIV